MTFFSNTPCILYFCKMEFNGDAPHNHDHYQEGQDHQEHPPKYMITISPQIPHVSYIFGKLR